MPSARLRRRWCISGYGDYSCLRRSGGPLRVGQKHLGAVGELVVALCAHVRAEVDDAVVVQLGEAKLAAQLAALRRARPAALERAHPDDRLALGLGLGSRLGLGLVIDLMREDEAAVDQAARPLRVRAEPLVPPASRRGAGEEHLVRVRVRVRVRARARARVGVRVRVRVRVRLRVRVYR